MAFKSNDPANMFAQIIDRRIREHSEKPLVLDFGSIGSDFSLITNTFPVNIPTSDYSVCRNISGRELLKAENGEHGGHEGGSGTHEHKIKVPLLKPGDRVLVAWVQDEPVVIDIIIKGSSL